MTSFQTNTSIFCQILLLLAYCITGYTASNQRLRRSVSKSFEERHVKPINRISNVCSKLHNEAPKREGIGKQSFILIPTMGTEALNDARTAFYSEINSLVFALMTNKYDGCKLQKGNNNSRNTCRNRNTPMHPKYLCTFDMTKFSRMIYVGECTKSSFGNQHVCRYSNKGFFTIGVFKTRAVDMTKTWFLINHMEHSMLDRTMTCRSP
ncbi:uncharacterized protein LOC134261735 [Saccostrea cucullata]|uniref:uncharacterized protein LOC134261735 n=1 Tax=Saccostrea cuccullata TaxID=36930 RepID=UPI002ED43D2C